MSAILAICGVVWLVDNDAFTDDVSECPSVVVVEVQS
jgi:hypothetical protein